jgi:tRNA pseudouridine13 synthase
MKPRAVFRRFPEDFAVSEIPLYEPSGDGEHLFVTIQKRNLTTTDATEAICAALGVDARSAGHAGMKDRRAVATQTVSVPYPTSRSPEEALAIRVAGLSILGAVRHRNKLKPGHLKGNRFSIVLRDLAASEFDGVLASVQQIGQHGVPNAFGPQRFGRDGGNPDRAIAWLSGRDPGPRDRRQRRLLFSALQSHFFNLVLERRTGDGTWAQPLVGDLLKKHQSGGIFLCADAAVDAERAARGELSPTGPIFGLKMRWPEGRPAEIERAVLGDAAGGPSPFDAHPNLGEGSRRSLRIFAEDLRIERLGEEPAALRVDFVLPKGGYATTLLGSVLNLEEESQQKP